MTRTVAIGRAIPDHNLGVADTGQEAVLLQEPVILLLFGVEEVLSDAPEESLAIGHRFKSLNDSFLGFWLWGS